MKKIMLIGNHDIVIYNFRRELIERLLREGHEVYIVLPYGKKVDLLVEMGCHFVDVKIDRRGTNVIADFSLLRNYGSILRKIKPDIVLTYTIKPNIYGGIACRIKKIPYIANITGLGSAVENEGILQRITVMLYRAAFKHINCVFFQNTGNRQFFIDRKIAIDKHRLISGSGVNLDEHCFEEYPDGEEIIFLYIGRLMREKGIFELFETAKRICNEYSNVQFQIVGFCEEDIEEALTKLVAENVVIYHGKQDTVHEYIKNSHAVILPSYHEGMANVLLEGAATGRAILASNIHGCKETFEEDVTGIGFEPRSVESLYRAVTKFLALSFEEKKNMGISGRRKMEKEFDRQNVVRAYIEEIGRAMTSGLT